MTDLEDFRQMVADEEDLLPEVFFKDLNGGVIVQEDARLHPDRVADDLYILGTYSRNAAGRQITLYYGSFERTMGFADREQMRMKVREVLRHEFRHHLEFLSGVSGKESLAAEDEKSMRDYFAMHGRKKPESEPESRDDAAPHENGVLNDMQEETGADVPKRKKRFTGKDLALLAGSVAVAAAAAFFSRRS